MGTLELREQGRKWYTASQGVGRGGGRGHVTETVSLIQRDLEGIQVSAEEPLEVTGVYEAGK